VIVLLQRTPYPEPDPRRRELGANMSAIVGAVFVLGGLLWFLWSGMSARDAIVSIVPLALIFAAFVWALRDSMKRVAQVAFALALIVTVATVLVELASGN